MEKITAILSNKDQAISYLSEKAIHEIFQEVAEKHLDKIAITYDGNNMTYRELNERSNQLARVLRKKGVKRGTLVGLIMVRSFEMIIGIFAILKSGGAYLPIDPQYPIQRVNYMINDSGINLIITQKHILEYLSVPTEVLSLDDLDLKSEVVSNLENINKPNDLAYIIYTSGTTGNPKGVMIEHKNVVALLVNENLPYEFESTDVYLLFHSYCFDVSVWEIYGALLYGGRLVIVPRMTIVVMNPQ